MSVRAYKILGDIPTAKRPTFNLWHDSEVIDLLPSFCGELGEGGGIIEIDEEAVNEAMERVPSLDVTDERKKELTEILQAIKNDMENGYVRYYCF